jgi:signal transduction histidine kinase/CheY-like chemotaxis protein
MDVGILDRITGTLGINRARRYLVIGAALVAALLFRIFLDRWLHDAHVLVTMYAAVAVAVWIGGYRPAIVVTILGYLACNWLFMEPRHTLVFGQADQTAGLLAFLATTTVIISLGEGARIAHRRARDAMRQAIHDSNERKRADQRKDEFLAVLAHELRNPLAPIGYASEILKKPDIGTSELRWARDVIDRQVQQMSRLLDDLLDVSRITRGTIELRRKPVDIAWVVRDAIEASRPHIDAGGHHLLVELPEAPVHVDGDQTRLAQVLLNLLNNAARYTERGGRIRLSVSTEGARVAIRVKDNGIGIDAAKLPVIFEMFSQADNTVEPGQIGLGIGLNLAKRLVEMHGGTMEARSEGTGRGSEFIVRLPVVRNVPDSVAARPEEPRAAASPLVILVVDDNRDAADGMAKFLQSMGHTVHTGYDGRSAVEGAVALHPDAIILDIGLPVLNGYDAIRAIRERGEKALAIALTGWGQEQHRRRSQEAGFDHHLTKPVNFAELSRLLAGSPQAPQRISDTET